MSSTTYQISPTTRLIVSDANVTIQDRDTTITLDHGEAREIAEDILQDLTDRYDGLDGDPYDGLTYEESQQVAAQREEAGL